MKGVLKNTNSKRNAAAQGSDKRLGQSSTILADKK